MMREASTDERSISFLTTTALARLRQLSRPANLLKATRCCSFSEALAHRQTTQLRKRQKGAPTFRCNGSDEIRRSQTLPLDHRLAAVLPGRSAYLCEIHLAVHPAG